MANDQPGALDGLTVLDVGLLVQGPQAALLLGELGAEVIKVEMPNFGDHARWVVLGPTDLRSAFFVSCNRGKRSITIDLHTDPGRDVFLDLARRADVVVSNFAAGTMESWGVGFDDLLAVNPRIIYAAGTTYGPEGSAVDRKGADLAAQAAGGLMRAIPDGPLGPTGVGATIADHIASQNLATGVLAALYARERTGRGQRVDCSLLGGQIYAQAAEYAATAMRGDMDAPSQGGHPGIIGVYGVVPTADGAIAIVGASPKERGPLFALLGAPELADDPRFMEPMISGADQHDLFATMAPHFAQRTTAEWGELLGEAGLRWAPVRTRSEVAADPDVYANGYLQLVDHGDGGELALAAAPLRLSDTPTKTLGTAPELGQHTEEILLELGRTWDDIAALRDAGAI